MTIATMRTSLTQDDIRRLVRGDSPEARANAAHKICKRIDAMDMADEDRESARQILDLMCNDAAVLVRRALAVFTTGFSCYSGCRQYREDLYAAQQAVGPTAVANVARAVTRVVRRSRHFTTISAMTKP